MKSPIFLIFFLSSLLFTFSPIGKERGVATYRLAPRAIETRLNLLRYDFKERENAALLTSYNTGVRRGIKKTTQKAHERLHLQHLFTPSGLHLSAAFWLLFPLIWYQRRTKSQWAFYLLIGLCLMPQILEGFYALKRVGLLKACFLIRTKLKLQNLPAIGIFLFVFTLDFLFGTYRDSPLSFNYSFLFLGLIFCAGGRPKIYFFFYLFLGQVFISFISQTPIYILGFALGMLATSLFTFIFPLLVLSFWFAPYLPPLTWIDSLIGSYKQMIFWGEQLSLSGPIITAGWWIFFLLGGYILFSHEKKRFIFLGLMVFTSNPLWNHSHPFHPLPEGYSAIQSQSFSQLQQTRVGTRAYNEKNQRCLLRLAVNNRWFEKCQNNF